MLLSCQSCSRWENAITLAVSLCPRAGGFSYRSVHNRRHIFNVLWCVPAYAPLSLPRACACCITAVDVARRYELHALAARQRRQLTPRLLVTGWTLLLLAQLAMLSACMHGRPRRRRYHRRRRRRRRHHRRRPGARALGASYEWSEGLVVRTEVGGPGDPRPLAAPRGSRPEPRGPRRPATRAGPSPTAPAPRPRAGLTRT